MAAANDLKNDDPKRIRAIQDLTTLNEDYGRMGLIVRYVDMLIIFQRSSRLRGRWNQSLRPYQ